MHFRKEDNDVPNGNNLRNGNNLYKEDRVVANGNDNRRKGRVTPGMSPVGMATAAAANGGNVLTSTPKEGEAMPSSSSSNGFGFGKMFTSTPNEEEAEGTPSGRNFVLRAANGGGMFRTSTSSFANLKFQ